MDDEAIEMEALEHIMSDASADPMKLSYGLMRSITNNFSNEIGRGGFGVVYKGVLETGDVAIKKLINLHALTEKQYLDEITCLKKAKHNNIVRFLGYCSETQGQVLEYNGKNVLAEVQQKLLCFEYVPNGDIKNYLQQDKNHGDDWPLRYKMIRGICQGLHFLHGEHISHLDLKPENVMLDAHMEPKITDFGLSRFLDEGQSKIITQNVVGTLRYIAPEAIDHGEISLKSDMYALGIIIIELLTGTSMKSLGDWDESLDLLDCPRAMMCVEIARNCTDAKRDNRPTIQEVIHRIDSLENTIPKSFTMNQLVVAPAFPGTMLLDVYPLERRFVLTSDKDSMYCHLTITNNTNGLVYCLIVLHGDSSRNFGQFIYNMDPMSSLVIERHFKAEEELPSYMVKWEILMFTIRYEGVELDEVYQSIEEDTPFEDAVKAIQEALGGELHRVVLKDYVIVEHPVEVHLLGKEEETSLDIKSMDVHPTEPWVLLITGDTVYIWNWQSNEKVGEYNYRDVSLGGAIGNIEKSDNYRRLNLLAQMGRGKSTEYPVAKFIARKLWVVIGDLDGSIRVHTCPTMDRVKGFYAHEGGISVLAVHPTRPFLLSFGSGSLNLWDWSRDWSCTQTFSFTDTTLRTVSFGHKDTTTFATYDSDDKIQMWTIGRPNPIATLPLPVQVFYRSNNRCGLTYTGNQDLTAVIHEDGAINIWDLRNEKHVYTLHTGEKGILVAACHPTDPILVTVSKKGRIHVWDSTTYRLKMAYVNLPEYPTHLGFTGSGRVVIGYDNKIVMMDIDLDYSIHPSLKGRSSKSLGRRLWLSGSKILHALVGRCKPATK